MLVDLGMLERGYWQC